MDYLTLMAATDEILKHKDALRNYHGRNVAELAIKVCGVVDFKPTRSEMEYIYFGCGLHDIGKIFISDTLLNKPRSLTTHEFEVMKTHVSMGRKLAETLGFHPIVKDIIYLHHENMDGTGYLSGKISHEIPWYARMARVLDAYDALSSDRSYRQALTPALAVAEIERDIVRHFDPLFVNALKQVVLDKERNGTERTV